jgi:hypothetical protein
MPVSFSHCSSPLLLVGPNSRIRLGVVSFFAYFYIKQ